MKTDGTVILQGGPKVNAPIINTLSGKECRELALMNLDMKVGDFFRLEGQYVLSRDSEKRFSVYRFEKDIGGGNGEYILCNMPDIRTQEEIDACIAQYHADRILRESTRKNMEAIA